MAKGRRSAVDLVVGGGEESPLAKKMRAQREAADAARNGDAGRPPVVDPPPRVEVAHSAPEAKPAQAPETRLESRAASSSSVGRASAGYGKDQKITKRVQVSRDEAKLWENACAAITEEVGAEVTYSVACRTMMALLLEAQDMLPIVAAPQLRRPANGDTLGFADFEKQLGDYLLAVLRRRRDERR